MKRAVIIEYGKPHCDTGPGPGPFALHSLRRDKSVTVVFDLRASAIAFAPSSPMLLPDSHAQLGHDPKPYHVDARTNNVWQR